MAEEIIFGEDNVTTGASNDIERATEIARNMVTKWGLSKRLGAQTFAEDEQEIFLGRSMAGHTRALAPETLSTIDEEVRDWLESCYQKSRQVLQDNVDILHAMAAALVKFETIDMNQIQDLMERKPVREREEPTPPPKPSGDAPKAPAEDKDKSSPDATDEPANES